MIYGPINMGFTSVLSTFFILDIPLYNVKISNQKLFHMGVKLGR